MASSLDWCYLHKQEVRLCSNPGCKINANDRSWNPESILKSDVTTEIPTINQGAVELNEFYSSYVRAGFDPRQALYLTGCMLTGQPGIAPPITPPQE